MVPVVFCPHDPEIAIFFVHYSMKRPQTMDSSAALYLVLGTIFFCQYLAHSFGAFLVRVIHLKHPDSSIIFRSVPLLS